MCIVSVLKKSDGSILMTHNRDEWWSRKSSQELNTEIVHGVEATFPKDLKAGGTWVISSEYFAACILNGGKIKHKRKSSYRKSRGLVLLDLIQFKSIKSFWKSIDLSGMEPFTIIAIEKKTQLAYRLVWDEKLKYRMPLNKILHVFSSSTLYNESQKKIHREKFTCHITKNSTTDKVTEIHTSLRMKFNPQKPKVYTSSITQIHFSENQTKTTHTPYTLNFE